jgi:hypothetical protein
MKALLCGTCGKEIQHPVYTTLMLEGKETDVCNYCLINVHGLDGDDFKDEPFDIEFYNV